MPYTKSIKEGEILFEVDPEKAPSFLQASFFLLLAPVLVLWIVDMRLGVISAISLFTWLYLIQNSRNVKGYRKKITFTASINGIRINNRFYSKENIHRLKIRNHIDKDYVMAVHKYAMPGSVATTLGLREKLLQVSYRVDMEAGGIAIVIAGGVTEATAYAIVSDVNRIFEW